MYGSNTFTISALEVCGCSARRYGRFTSGKEPVPFVQEAESAWGPVRMTQRICRHRDSIPKPAIRTLSQYRLRHPGRQSKNTLFEQIFTPFFKKFGPKSLNFCYAISGEDAEIGTEFICRRMAGSGLF